MHPNILTFLVKPDLDDTWLAHPQGSDCDPIGTWLPKKLNFSSKNNWVPEAFAKQQPKRVPFKFTDTECEEFFEEIFLFRPNTKIPLPTGIFSPNSNTVSDKNLHLFEYWGRQGVLDCEVTHNMLDLNNDMLLGIHNVIRELDLSSPEAKNTLDGVKNNVENIIHFNTLATQSNYRSKTFAIQTNVKAKSELRSIILEKYEGDEDVIEKLSCSSFFTNSLFGPIPKAMTNPQTSCSGRKALLQAKKFKAQTKRKGQVNYSQAKRGRFDFNKNRNNFNYVNKFDSYNDNFNRYESKYATNSLFPKGGQRGAKIKRGKRGSKH